CRHDIAPEDIYCGSCGLAQLQQCPYGCDPGEMVRISVTPSGAVGVCRRCNGLYLVCSECRTYYTMTDTQCRTEDCGGALVEIFTSFPSVFGPLDGSRCSTWPYAISDPDSPVHTASVAGRVEAMAFRYGVLIAVTNTSVQTRTWEASASDPPKHAE